MGCSGCQKSKIQIPDTNKPLKFILRSSQSPGDILMLTAAVRDLTLSYPNKYLVDVRTSAEAIWENNPYITPLDDKDKDVINIKMEYPIIHSSNESPYHFIHGYRKFLSSLIKRPIRPISLTGDLFLSENEKSNEILDKYNINTPFWIIVNGGKSDFTAKWPNPEHMQKVVEHFRGKILFVQVGEISKQSDNIQHIHFPLEGAYNLIGKTSLRELIQLIYHSDGVLCPVTFAMHAAAAVPPKSRNIPGKPCVVIAGGREPAHWEAYSWHRFLSTVGSLPCCSTGGCWVSRCQIMEDGDDKDNKNLCKYPESIKKDIKLVIPKCINMIKPRQIIDAVNSYYEGGILK